MKAVRQELITPFPMLLNNLGKTRNTLLTLQILFVPIRPENQRQRLDHPNFARLLQLLHYFTLSHLEYSDILDTEIF